MVETNPPAENSDSSRIVSLPYALYDSNGLLFELYQGGQTLKRHQFKWVRVGQTTEESNQDSGQL